MEEDTTTTTTTTIINYKLLSRYNKCDPEDYQDRFQTLPGDENTLDENLVAPAMVWNPQQRNFIRSLQKKKQQPHHANQEEVELQRIFWEKMRRDNNMIMVDPADGSPLVEMFLRSMLPWNSVE